MSKQLLAWPTMACLVLSSACSKDSGPSGPPAGVTATVEVNPTTVSLSAVGATQLLSAVVKDGTGASISGKTVSWSSANTGVATVALDGTVTAVANGSAVITASVDGKSGTATVTVAQQVAQLVFVTHPPSTTAGTPWAVQVAARDSRGALVASFTGAVSLNLAQNPGNATLAGTTTVNANGGTASFSGLSIAKAASGYQVSAASGTLSTGAGTAFNILPGAVAKLVFVAQPLTAIEANVAAALRASVEQRDAFDNPVPGASIDVRLVNAPWARTRLLGTTAGTATGAVVQFQDLTVDRPGTGYRLEAFRGTITAQSNVFAVTTTFSSVSVGGENSSGSSFSCGIALGGTFCWGVNYASQLGSSRAANEEWVPFLVDAPATFVEVTTGVRHACGRTEAGQVFCWGEGTSGELGHGQTTSSSVPVLVNNSGPSGGRVYTAIDAGGSYTCGVVSTGVYCWGRNTYGQLGTGNTASASIPQRISGTGIAPLDFRTISAGHNHSCGVTNSAAVWCWGAAFVGVLGDGQELVHRLAPVQVVGSGVAPLQFASVTTGLSRTCGLTAGAVPDRIYCWGSNSGGYLGLGASAGQGSYLVPTAIAGAGTSWRSVSVGYNTICAADTSSQLWCWGRGLDGETGNGLLLNQPAPVATSGPAGGLPRVSAGGTNVCGIGTSGAFCWGSGLGGAIGDGANQTRAVPTRVVQ